MNNHLPITGRIVRGLALAGAVLLATSTGALGGSISIAPIYVQSFDSSLNSLGTLPSGGAPTPVGGFLQYEFRMTLDNLAVDEDFWTAIFNVELGPGLSIGSEWLDPATAQLNGYYPASPSLTVYDGNGGSPGGSQFHWQFGNADFGLSPNDLQTIIIEAAPQEALNRQYGESLRPLAGDADGLGWPTLVGTILAQRTALIPSSVTVTPIDGSAWGTYVGNTLGEGLPTAHTNPATFSGGTAMLIVPEPGTLTLVLVLGALAMLVNAHTRLLRAWRAI